MRILSVILAVLAVAFSAGSVAADEQGDEAQIRELLQSQLDFLHDGDVAGYMSTIASDAPGRAATEQQLRQMSGYTLQFTLEDVQVLTVEETRAVERVVQTTRAEG